MLARVAFFFVKRINCRSQMSLNQARRRCFPSKTLAAAYQDIVQATSQSIAVFRSAAVFL